MKKFLCIMIALAIGMPMMAQIVLNNDLKKVVGQYPGKIKVAADEIAQLKTDPWKPATGTIEQGSTDTKFNITIGGFTLGTLVFHKVTIKNAELKPTQQGISYYVSDFVKGVAKVENTKTKQTSQIEVEILPGTQYIVSNKKLTTNLSFVYQDVTIYIDFEGESKTATGIAGLRADTNKAQTIYDLSGRAVSKTRKGICIIDGKKVVVR